MVLIRRNSMPCTVRTSRQRSWNQIAKGLVVCNSWDLEPSNGLAQGLYQPPWDVWLVGMAAISTFHENFSLNIFDCVAFWINMRTNWVIEWDVYWPQKSSRRSAVYFYNSSQGNYISCIQIWSSNNVSKQFTIWTRMKSVRPCKKLE